MKRIFSLLVLAITLSLVVSSCWYNRKWEDLHPTGQSNTSTSCDTAGVMSYSVHIKPIMTGNCNMSGCHDGISAIDFSQYNNVRNSGLAGTLMFRLSLPPSNPMHMPQGQGYLPACDTLQLKKWIQNGCPNN